MPDQKHYTMAAGTHRNPRVDCTCGWTGEPRPTWGASYLRWLDHHREMTANGETDG